MWDNQRTWQALGRAVQIAAVSLATSVVHAQEGPPVRISDSPAAVVFDWGREHCVPWDVPDAPLRAFRTAAGQVVAFASGKDSRPLTGRTLATLAHGCHSSLASPPAPDPARYRGDQFLTAFWTSDGVHVSALVHNEYHAERFGACAYAGGLACWYNTVLSASSADAGQTFRLADPPAVVAAAPDLQEVGQGRHRGFFNPSNILYRDGAWFMAAHTTGGPGGGPGDGPGQRPGTCLFRSTNVDDPHGWRAFDGQTFSAASVDPYRDDARRYVPCQPMTGVSTLGSISWYPPRGLYLGVFQGPDREHPGGSISYAWSADMLHWGPHRTLLDAPDMSSKNCADTVRYGYPSVLSETAPGRNFDSIDDAPFLFLTRFHVVNCTMPPNRDLVRFQLRID